MDGGFIWGLSREFLEEKLDFLSRDILGLESSVWRFGVLSESESSAIFFDDFQLLIWFRLDFCIEEGLENSESE